MKTTTKIGGYLGYFGYLQDTLDTSDTSNTLDTSDTLDTVEVSKEVSKGIQIGYLENTTNSFWGIRGIQAWIPQKHN